MQTPFNTGKVLIGINYQAPQMPWSPTRTEAMLQDALLARKPSIDWDGITIALVFGVVLALVIVGSWIGQAL